MLHIGFGEAVILFLLMGFLPILQAMWRRVNAENRVSNASSSELRIAKASKDASIYGGLN